MMDFRTRNRSVKHTARAAAKGTGSHKPLPVAKPEETGKA